MPYCRLNQPFVKVGKPLEDWMSPQLCQWPINIVVQLPLVDELVGTTDAGNPSACFETVQCALNVTWPAHDELGAHNQITWKAAACGLVNTPQLHSLSDEPY